MSREEEDLQVCVIQDTIDDTAISQLEDEIKKLICIHKLQLYLMTDHAQTRVKVRLDKSETPITI